MGGSKMTVLEIEFADGSIEEVTVISGVITEQWEEQSRASIEVFRDEWQSLVDKIDKINDDFYISVDGNREFGGRLVNYTNEQDSVNLEIGSFEEDAITAQPTDPTEEFITSDSEIVNDAISRIPNLSAGEIDTITTDIGFVFSNSSPAKMIRDCQSTTVAFVSYNPDKTIDYKEFPTGTNPVATIGPSEGNVQDDFTVIENEREEFTHIRVLGAGEGDSRIQVEGSVSNFSGRENWGKFSDTDITSESRANEVLDNLLEEYEENPIRRKVETTVFGVELEIGSKVEVVSEKDSINEEMFVIKLERIFEGNRLIYNVTLSNRLISEEDRSKKQRKSVENFNEGYQGQIVTINSGGYRAPLDDGKPYEFSIRYPDDVVDELTAEIELDSLYYRSYVSATDHSHSVDVDDSAVSENNSEYNQSVSDGSGTSQGSVETESRENITSTTISTDDSTTDAINVGTDISELYGAAAVYIKWEQEAEITNNCSIYLEDESGTRYSENEYVYATPIDGGLEQWISFVGVVPRNTKGENIRMYLDNSVGENIETYLAHTQWFASGKHTHDVTISDSAVSSSTVAFDPGVNVWDGNDKSPELTPSSVDVIVNGNTVASNVNSGIFTETVDIGGELTSGFNTVRVTSDSLGHMRATAFVDVFRQITQ